ncbi:unnamed protein product [Sphagnum tenellum]
MDGRFHLAGVAGFALGRDTHELQLGAYQEALVEGQPDECPNLLWESVARISCTPLRRLCLSRIGGRGKPSQGRVWIWDANPFPWLGVAGAFVWAPRDAGSDGLLASPVRHVVAHPEFGKALPVSFLRVPQVFDSRASVSRKSVPVSHASESQRGAACVEN